MDGHSREKSRNEQIGKVLIARLFFSLARFHGRIFSAFFSIFQKNTRRALEENNFLITVRRTI